MKLSELAESDQSRVRNMRAQPPINATFGYLAKNQDSKVELVFDLKPGSSLLDSQPAKLSAHDMEMWLMAHPEHASMATIRNRFRKRGISSITGIFQDVRARTSR